eukprot:5280031-Amphidinium_carterae.1
MASPVERDGLPPNCEDCIMALSVFALIWAYRTLVKTRQTSGSTEMGRILEAGKATSPSSLGRCVTHTWAKAHGARTFTNSWKSSASSAAARRGRLFNSAGRHPPGPGAEDNFNLSMASVTFSAVKTTAKG